MSRPVREDREEIMQLIVKLHGRKAQGARALRAAAQRSAAAASTTRRRPVLPTPAQLAPAASGARSGASDVVLDLLRKLDARMDRMEALLEKRMQSTAAPKPVAGSSDALFGGIIKESVLPDMLQLVTSNQMTGRFVIFNEHASHSLFFREGDLYHAEGGGLRGEQSVFAAMALEAGKYEFTETTDIPNDATVTSNTQLLILEALRQIDESRAG